MIVNRRPKDPAGGDGYVDAEPTGYSYTIWGPTGENVAESLAKGDRVLIVGHIETETWTDRESGTRRTRDKVIVEEIGASLTWAVVRPTKNNCGTSSPESTEAPF